MANTIGDVINIIKALAIYDLIKLFISLTIILLRGVPNGDK